MRGVQQVDRFYDHSLTGSFGSRLRSLTVEMPTAN
jgi:hypothetical protein